MTVHSIKTQQMRVLNQQAQFVSDELVIAMPYEDLVINKLAEWTAAPDARGADDRDPALGLVRVRLNAAAAVAYLHRDNPALVSRVREEARREGYEPQDLDITLRCLRHFFSETYSQWVPTFGKNRVLERVAGSYVIDGGGKGGPRAVPNYVIDGGGVGPVTSVTQRGDKLVAPRGAKPGRGARVGVVDTRLFPHPWLSGGYLARAADLISPREANATAKNRQLSSSLADHATFVTGLVLRQAPGAVVDVHSGLDDQASNDSWSVARAIAAMGADSVDVINLSLGCVTEDGHPPLVLGAALATLGPDTVVVAAAGNHGDPEQTAVAVPVWPAAFDNVIAVGALDRGKPAAFSPEAPWVDAMAPGVDLVSTCDTKRDGSVVFARWSGTSFAAAVVSGAVAGLMNGAGSARAAWQQLKETSDTDDLGRPQVPLRDLADWPHDGASSD